MVARRPEAVNLMEGPARLRAMTTRLSRCSGLPDKGHENPEARSTIRVVGGPNLPAMGADDRLANGQAHAHAALPGREEAGEHMLQIGLRDTGTGVPNGELDPVRRRGGPQNDGAFGRADLVYRLDRINEQVHHHLLELDAIPFDGRKSAIEIERDIDPLLLALVA